MAIKALIFGVDDLFNELKPFYEMFAQRGEIEVVGYANFEKDGVKLYPAKEGVNPRNFKIAIISSREHFYDRMKLLENMGVKRNKILDGYAFKVPNLKLNRLISEGIAYGLMEDKMLSWKYTFPLSYKKIYKVKNSESIISFDKKSYINGGILFGDGSLFTGKFCSISSQIAFHIGHNVNHNYKNVSHYSLGWWGWDIDKEFYPINDGCKIEIGNDFWIGLGSTLISNNPERPLKIGDGAVIASNSVVVKNIPPYAIVGGNPAQVIKYRFDGKIIESLLRIKWWDWDIDKIHDNFKYFNQIEKFVELHDKF